MGSAYSAAAAVEDDDTTWLERQADFKGMCDAEWRSERAKELDKLGGKNREAVKRGKSFQKRMDWLQAKLKEQGEQMEDALARDPLAGRHEIIQQERKKAVKEDQEQQLDKVSKSVKEWQNKKHINLRSEMRQLRKEREERERMERNMLAGKGGGFNVVKPKAKGGSDQKKDPEAELKKTTMKTKLQDYYLNMEANRSKKEDERVSKARRIQSAYRPTMGRSRRVTTLNGADWRGKVLDAKRTAWQTLAPLVKLQVLSRTKPKGLQRIDSFSFYVKNVLGAELPRFQEECVKYQDAAELAAEAKRQLDALHQARLAEQSRRAAEALAKDQQQEEEEAEAHVEEPGKPGAGEEEGAGSGDGAVRQSWDSEGPVSPDPRLQGGSRSGHLPGSSDALFAPSGDAAGAAAAGPGPHPPMVLKVQVRAGSSTGSAAGLRPTIRSRTVYAFGPQGNGSAGSSGEDSRPGSASRSGTHTLPRVSEGGASVSVGEGEAGVGPGSSREPRGSTSGSMFFKAGRPARSGPVYAPPLQVPRGSYDGLPALDVPSPTMPNGSRPSSQPRGGRATLWSSNSPTPSPTGASTLGRPNASAASLLFPGHFAPRRASVNGTVASIATSGGAVAGVRVAADAAAGRGSSSAGCPSSPNSVLPPPTPLGRESSTGLLSASISTLALPPVTVPPNAGAEGPFSPTPPSAPKPIIKRSIVCKEIELDGNEAELEQEQELMRKLAAAKTAMNQPLKLLTMYAHRCNALWAEAQQWEPPQVHAVQSFSAVAGGGKARVFREGVLKMLREGRFALQIMMGDDYVQPMPPPPGRVSTGATPSAAAAAAASVAAAASFSTPVSLWSVDPWELASSAVPSKAATYEHVTGVTMGPRLLMAFVTAVEALAGKGAVDKLIVILHCNSDQEAAVVADLWEKRWCGLKPENVHIMVEQRRVGYRYDADQRRFVARMLGCKSTVGRFGGGRGFASSAVGPAAGIDAAQAPLHQQAGSGFCMMQLAWPGEAYCLSPDGPASPHSSADMSDSPRAGYGGVYLGSPASADSWETDTASGRVPMQNSALDHLSSRGVTFLLTRRLQDLTLYSPESTLDLDGLAYGLLLHEQHGANMMVQVDMHASGSGGAGRGSDRSAADGLVLAHRSHGGESVPPGSPMPVVEIKGFDLQTPTMSALEADVRGASRGRGLARSTGRYATSIKLLKSLLTSPAVFRPSLSCKNGRVYVHVDAADLTAAPATYCVAVAGRSPAKTMVSVEDVDDLMVAVAAQDVSGPFRRLLGSVIAQAGPRKPTAPKRPPVPPAPASVAAGPGQAAAQGSEAGGKPGLQQAPSQGHAGPLTQPQGQPPAPRHRTTYAGTSASVSGGVTQPRTPGQHSPLPVVVAAMQHRQSAPGNAAFAQGPGHATGPGEGAAASGGSQRTSEDGSSRRTVTGQRILVLVADNNATYGAMLLALSLLRPGKDLLHLVTMVPSVLHETGGRELCARYEAMAKVTLTETQSDVLLKGTLSTIDQLESFVTKSGADLVVLGSEELAGNSIPMGSISIGLMKAITKPVILVKANAKNAVIDWSKDRLRCMLQVEHSSRPLLKYICSKLLNPARYDQLYLARSFSSERLNQDTVTARRLLDNFSELANAMHLGSVKKPLDGAFEVDGCKVADAEKIHIMAVQAPAGRAMPDHILKLIKNTTCAVLLYKTNDQW